MTGISVSLETAAVSPAHVPVARAHAIALVGLAQEAPGPRVFMPSTLIVHKTPSVDGLETVL